MKKSYQTGAFWPSLYELLSSMRFAVGLLTILAIASVIGTVLQQNQPYPSYVAEFGQYWFSIFEWMGLFDVYHSTWFLVLLGFLVLSTSLCVWRNTPNFVREIRGWRERASETSLAAMSHSTVIPRVDAKAADAYLRRAGFQVKQTVRDDGAVMVVGKRGAGNKLGYFFAHIALVVICIGGLIDGNLPLKVGEMLGELVPETRDMPQGQVPEHSRLSSDNLSYRGTVTIPENSSVDVVFLNAGRGYFVQELPFIITLKAFQVDYYSNGMPKLFASDIIVTNKQTGEERSGRVEVNHPMVVDGVAIYQSSFGDGGSPLRFKAWNLAHPHTGAVPIQARSMNAQRFHANGQDYQLEVGEFRVFNIQDMSDPSVLPEQKKLGQALDDARNVVHEKNLRNVGPSIQFKLRDAQGQAVEYFNYMSPMVLEERPYLVSGMRRTPAEPFSYMRIPLDERGEITGFMRLFAALKDDDIVMHAANRAADKAQSGNAISAAMRDQFRDSVQWVLQRFAVGGFGALEGFLDERVPKDKQQMVAQTYIKILQGAIVDVDAIARERAKMPAIEMNSEHYRFLLDALVAVSSVVHDYHAPVFLQLESFEHVQASGLQLTRSPGKTVVYVGSLLLVLGIICMFYIREVRVWVRISADNTRFAISSNRKNRDLDTDFERHQHALQQLAQAHSEGKA